MATQFYEAKHNMLVLKIVGFANMLNLAWHNYLHIRPQDLHSLKNLSQDSGLILVPNHADESDIPICIEVSRLLKRRFTYMVNSEAFEGWLGFAGWWLQRLGCFSVERSGNDQTSRRYAIDAVKKGETLVIFAEGEVYYLNDLVQPFKTGAVHTGLQALIENANRNPHGNVQILPVAIKYCYRRPIKYILRQKIKKIEKRLMLQSRIFPVREKIINIMAKLLNRQDLINHIRKRSDQLKQLKLEIEKAQLDLVSTMESKYQITPPKIGSEFTQRARKMMIFLREQLKHGKIFNRETRIEFARDFQSLKQAIQMGEWQPPYIGLHPSDERLAETVMKLERQVYGKTRPHPLGDRSVFLRIARPIDLRPYANEYRQDPSRVAHEVTERLHSDVQGLIEKL